MLAVVLLISPASVFSFSSGPASNQDKWAPLRALLQGWEFTRNYAVVVGDKDGRQFLYEGGNFTIQTLIPTGSTSKWPSAMMFAGLVNDGSIASLDDPVNKYLSWWTKDETDLRSTVTLRMLLTFTSGFGSGHPGQEGNTRPARVWREANQHPRVLSLSESLTRNGQLKAAELCDTKTGDITECARSIYETVKLIGVPGQVWNMLLVPAHKNVRRFERRVELLWWQVYSYNSNHLQLAAALAVAVTGLEIHEVWISWDWLAAIIGGQPFHRRPMHCYKRP